MADVATPARQVSAEWRRCPTCETFIYHKRLRRNLGVCPECNHHFRLKPRDRLDQLCDEGSYEELGGDLETVDVLAFTDSKPYPQRLAEAQRRTGVRSGGIFGTATIDGHPVVIAGIDFDFIGGSMGGAVGEAITRGAELALASRTPLLLICASGGARMQEGCVSLMQMVKTSQALGRLDEEGILYISLLTDPTYGGVSASFATLGDVLIAEPGARIGFAGPSVIEQTIRQRLPDGFQTASSCSSTECSTSSCRARTCGGRSATCSSCTRWRRRPGPGRTGARRTAARGRGLPPVRDAGRCRGARPVDRRAARPARRAPAHARLRRARLRRLQRAPRRPHCSSDDAAIVAGLGAARRADGDASATRRATPRRDDRAQLRDAAARRATARRCG